MPENPTRKTEHPTRQHELGVDAAWRTAAKEIGSDIVTDLHKEILDHLKESLPFVVAIVGENEKKMALRRL